MKTKSLLELGKHQSNENEGEERETVQGVKKRARTLKYRDLMRSLNGSTQSYSKSNRLCNVATLSDAVDVLDFSPCATTDFAERNCGEKSVVVHL